MYIEESGRRRSQGCLVPDVLSGVKLAPAQSSDARRPPCLPQFEPLSPCPPLPETSLHAGQALPRPVSRGITEEESQCR